MRQENFEKLIKFLNNLIKGDQKMSTQLDALNIAIANAVKVLGEAVTMITNLQSQVTNLQAEVAAGASDTAALAGITTNISNAVGPLQTLVEPPTT